MSPQKSAYTGHAGVAADGEGTAALVCVGDHGAELENAEMRSTKTESILAEEDGSVAVELEGDGDEQIHGRQQSKARSRNENI